MVTITSVPTHNSGNIRWFGCSHPATQRYPFLMTTSPLMSFVNLMMLLRAWHSGRRSSPSCVAQNHGHKKSVMHAWIVVSKKDIQITDRRKREFAEAFSDDALLCQQLQTSRPPHRIFKTYALMSPLWCLYLIHKSITNALNGHMPSLIPWVMA